MKKKDKMIFTGFILVIIAAIALFATYGVPRRVNIEEKIRINLHETAQLLRISRKIQEISPDIFKFVSEFKKVYAGNFRPLADSIKEMMASSECPLEIETIVIVPDYRNITSEYGYAMFIYGQPVHPIAVVVFDPQFSLTSSTECYIGEPVGQEDVLTTIKGYHFSVTSYGEFINQGSVQSEFTPNCILSWRDKFRDSTGGSPLGEYGLVFISTEYEYLVFNRNGDLIAAMSW